MPAARLLSRSAVAPLAAAALAVAGAGDASAQRPRSSGTVLATATVVALPLTLVSAAAPTVPATPAARTASGGGSAPVELAITLALAAGASYEVTVRPAAAGARRVLASVGGGPLCPVSDTDPLAAGGPAGRAAPVELRLRLEAAEGDSAGAVTVPVTIEIVAHAADAESTHRLTTELRAAPVLAAPPAPPAPSATRPATQPAPGARRALDAAPARRARR